MVGNRDDVVSSYVRHRIREWQAEKKELQELARKAGFAKSTPSQVLTGTGVGAKTAPRWAKALGFDSVNGLRMAAFEWWKTQGQAGAELLVAPKTDAMRDAIQFVIKMNQGTPEQLESILVAFTHPRFHDRAMDWWANTLLAELQRDREALVEDKRSRQRTSKQQRETRKLREQRPSEAPPSKRRKQAG